MRALERHTAGAQQTAGRQRFEGATQSVLIITRREQVALALSRCMSGYRVAHATTIEHALASGLEETFDLVVAHIEVADTAVLDGLEILRAYDPDLSVVLYTVAMPPAALAGVAASLGVLDVLTEPPTKAFLQRLLHQGTNERYAAAMHAAESPTSRVHARPESTGRAARGEDLTFHPVVDPHTQRVTAFVARGARALAGRAFTDRIASLFVDVSAAELFDGALLRDAALLAIANQVVLQVRLDDAALRDVDLLRHLASLRRVGYRLALVESPVRQYVDLPPIEPDFLVLDARLTRRIDTSRGRQAIVRALVEKGHALDALVMAVGVSSREERAALVDAQCDLVQGPLVDRRRAR